jgi:hypothetical protein
MTIDQLCVLFQVSEAELAPGLLAHQVLLHSAAQVVLNKHNIINFFY